jgi:hypothetical protein
MQEPLARTLYIKRLSIVEWLADGEPRTGFDLAQCASKWAPEVEHLPCQRASHVIEALNYLKQSVPERQVPIVHFEAHGMPGEHGGLAPDSDCSEFLSWEQLRQPLRELNIATRFNLVVFGAACYGIGFLAAIAKDLGSAAFVASIGFADSIPPGSLLRITKEFYRSFFCDGGTIDEAIASANRESFLPATERLHAGAVDLLLIEAIRKLVTDDLTLEEAADAYTWQACEVVAARILAHDLFPENRTRFPVDLTKLLPARLYR